MANYTNTSTFTNPLTRYLDYVEYVYVPLFVIVGVIGNSLTITVMSSPNFSRLPVSRLLIAMSLADMIINLLLPFNQNFVRVLAGRDLKAFSSGGCKLYFCMYRFARQTSSWMVVTISCERFIGVWMPVKAKRINTIRNAYIIIGVLCSLFIVYFGYLSSLADDVIHGICTPSMLPRGMERKFRAFVAVNLLSYYFIPSAVLIIANGLIIYKLIALAKKRRAQVTNTTVAPSGRKQTVRNERSRTNVMLLCVTTSFIILVAPNAIVHLVSFITKEHASQPHSIAIVVFRETAVIMEQLSHSMNIVLYVLSNSRFKNQLVAILKRSNSVSTNNDLNMATNMSSYQ